MRFEVILPMEFPDYMDDRDIYFTLNEGNWCMSNLIEMLENYDYKHGCICDICTAHVIPDGFYMEGRKHEKSDGG